MSNPEFHSCPDCGYQWRHGQHGGHSCLTRIKTEMTTLKSERQELLKSLESLLDITADSQGVAGYHLNGDVAEWGEFEEVSSAYELIKRIEGGE